MGGGVDSHGPSQSPVTRTPPLPLLAQASCPLTFHTASEGLADHSRVILLLCRPLIHVDSGSGRASIQHDSILQGKGKAGGRLGPSERSSHKDLFILGALHMCLILFWPCQLPTPLQLFLIISPIVTILLPQPPRCWNYRNLPLLPILKP